MLWILSFRRSLLLVGLIEALSLCLFLGCHHFVVLPQLYVSDHHEGSVGAKLWDDRLVDRILVTFGCKEFVAEGRLIYDVDRVEDELELILLELISDEPLDKEVLLDKLCH